MKKMKNLLKTISVIAIFMIGFTSVSMAQNTVQTSAGAKIVSALTVSNVGSYGLHFGTMTIPTSVATVTVPATGARTSTGTITLLSQAPTYSAAGYGVTGDGTSTYNITLPTSTTITNGTQSMTVDTFTSSKPSNMGTLVAGADAFTVGATLHLVSGQNSGTYTGSFDISVAYN